jgi:hypothetical protein
MFNKKHGGATAIADAPESFTEKRDRLVRDVDSIEDQLRDLRSGEERKKAARLGDRETIVYLNERVSVLESDLAQKREECEQVLRAIADDEKRANAGKREATAQALKIALEELRAAFNPVIEKLGAALDAQRAYTAVDGDVTQIDLRQIFMLSPSGSNRMGAEETTVLSNFFQACRAFGCDLPRYIDDRAHIPGPHR